MNNLKNIPHFLLIIISVAYSIFVVSHYLNTQFPFVYAVAGAFLIASLSHYYITLGIREINHMKKLTSTFIIGLILVSSIFFCEYKGVEIVAKNNIVDTSNVEKLDNQLSEFRSQLTNVSLKRDWRSIEQKRSIENQIKSLESLLMEEKEKVKHSTLEALNSANEFRFFSIVLVLLSMLASFCIDSTVVATVEQPKRNEKQRFKQPLESTVDNEKQRLNLAVEHIKKTGEASHNFLMKMFKLNPKQVKRAKEIAGYSTIEKQKAIGF